jgi:hypothetical protein
MSTMTKQQLKEALGVIWALVYRATQVPYLAEEQTTQLQDALRIISAEVAGDDYFNRRASYLAGCVRGTGILSVPSRKPKGTEEILSECQCLQRHLDSSSSNDRNA